MAGYSQYGGNPYGSGGNEGGYGSSNPYGDSSYGQSNPYGGGNQYASSGGYAANTSRIQSNEQSSYNAPAYQQPPSNYSRPTTGNQNAGGAPPLPPPPQNIQPGQGYASQGQGYPPQGQGYPSQGQTSQQPGQGAAYSRATPPMSNSDFLTRVEGVKGDINKLSNNVSEISTIHQKMVSSPDSSSTAQLEHLTSQTQILNTQIKDTIRYLKADALKSNNNPTKDSQIRNLEQTFKQRLEDYRGEEKHYSDRYKEQIGRQYRIVNPDASESEVREAVEADWGNEGVFQTALSSNRTGAANSVLGSVRARHNDIQKIEKTIMELNMLFEQLAEQVILQDAAVVATEQQTTNVRQDLTSGNQQLDKGVASARRARKMKWWCFFICLAIIIILGLVLGLYFGLKKATGTSGP